jgi:hypothetical protein
MCERLQIVDPSKGGAGYPEWARTKVLAWFDAAPGTAAAREAQITAFLNITGRTVRDWRAQRAVVGHVHRMPAAGGAPRLLGASHEVWLVAYLCKSPRCALSSLTCCEPRCLAALLPEISSIFLALLARSGVPRRSARRARLLPHPHSYRSAPSLAEGCVYDAQAPGHSAQSSRCRGHAAQPAAVRAVGRRASSRSCQSLRCSCCFRAACRVDLWFTMAPPVGIRGVPLQDWSDTDECTVFWANSSRGYGYAAVGQQARVLEKFTRGVKLNVLLTISIHGVVAFWIYDKNTNGPVSPLACWHPALLSVRHAQAAFVLVDLPDLSEAVCAAEAGRAAAVPVMGQRQLSSLRGACMRVAPASSSTLQIRVLTRFRIPRMLRQLRTWCAVQGTSRCVVRRMRPSQRRLSRRFIGSRRTCGATSMT